MHTKQQYDQDLIKVRLACSPLLCL